MTALIAALAIGIVSYIGFVMLFPKAVPDESGDYTRQALDRIYEENRQMQQERQQVMRDQLREESGVVRILLGASFMQPMYEKALQAGYQHNLRYIIYFMFGALFVVAGGCWYLGLGALGVVLAPAAAYLLPLRHCAKKIRKRNRKFIDQFPDALDMIVRSVRSGFPLSVALQMLAENTEDPVKAEFRQVVDEIALGRHLSEALKRMASRVNEPDIKFFVVVLSVQQETGGNLAEIIGNLSSIIRKRKQLRHKIHAMTAEGRATAWVLGSLPVLVFITLYFLNYDYISLLWIDSFGQILLGISIGLIALCVFVVKQMINVDI